MTLTRPGFSQTNDGSLGSSPAALIGFGRRRRVEDLPGRAHHRRGHRTRRSAAGASACDPEPSHVPAHQASDWWESYVPYADQSARRVPVPRTCRTFPGECWIRTSRSHESGDSHSCQSHFRSSSASDRSKLF